MSQPAKDNSLDSILADFENQYKQKNVSGNNSGNSSDRVNNAPMNNNDPLIDSFVNELTQQKSKPPSQIKSTNTDNNLDNLAQEFQQKGNQTKPKQKSSLTEESLNNIAQQFQQKREQDKQEQKTDNLEYIRRQELEKQRRIKQLTRQAEVWLKNLDPYSDEGFWFEQFANSYPSKLEAAIEYLKALQ